MALPALGADTDEGALTSGQQAFGDSLRYDVRATASFSHGDSSPFWLVSNRWGLASTDNNYGFLEAALFRDSRNIKKEWSYGYGVDVATGYNMQAPFLVQQLYADINYWNFRLTVGQKYGHETFTDQRLSSGDMLFSNNARPIPEVRISAPDYINIPGFKGFVGIKGYFSVGAFTDQRWQKSWTDGKRYTDNVLYQSKGGFLRIGNRDKFPLVAEGGFQMAAQWAGTSYRNGEKTKLPHSFKDFWRTFFCQGAGDDGLPGEQSNCNGNIVGEWSAQLAWDTDPWGAKVYYNHYYEDHSMLFMEYTWHDGLLGFEVRFPKNRFVSKAVYEYLYTKYQAGPVYWDHNDVIDQQISARDSYYNHGIYTGWNNWGFGLGNPLIISPVFNKDHTLAFKCNRVIAHHVGLEGQPWQRVGYRALASYTRGWGTYSAPFKNIERNLSLMLEVTYDTPFWSGFSVTVTGALDHGGLLGDNTGGMLTLRKTGLFSF